MNEWMNEWMNKWMNEWMNIWIKFLYKRLWLLYARLPFQAGFSMCCLFGFLDFLYIHHTHVNHILLMKNKIPKRSKLKPLSFDYSITLYFLRKTLRIRPASNDLCIEDSAWFILPPQNVHTTPTLLNKSADTCQMTPVFLYALFSPSLNINKNKLG